MEELEYLLEPINENLIVSSFNSEPLNSVSRIIPRDSDGFIISSFDMEPDTVLVAAYCFVVVLLCNRELSFAFWVYS